MIVCKVCGFDNEAGAQFCGNCGSFLEWTGESSTPSERPSADGGVPAAGAATVIDHGQTPLPGPSIDGVTCPNCGTINERDRVYCRHCATELAPPLAPVAAPVAATRRGIGLPPLVIGGVLVAVLVVGVAFVASGGLGRDDPLGVASPTPTVAASPTVAPSASASPTAAPTATPTPTPRPDPSGTIAWSSGTAGNIEIVTSSPDGSRIIRVFRIAGDDVQASWSPNGKRIAFASARGIRIVDADDGGNAVRFSHHDELDRAPAFSPDGSVIAFASSRGGDFEIYLRAVGGTNLDNLTKDKGADDDPAWSPVTNLIAFSSDRMGDRDIWTMKPNGKGLVQLTGAEGQDDHPAWSPDGATIAFTSDREGTTFIYLMNADGSDVRRLTSGDIPERHATWSPDGLYIAYKLGTGAAGQINVVSVDDGAVYATFAEEGKAASYPAWH